MQLFVIRHAVAVPRQVGTPDATRPLTPKGRRRWKRGVQGLARLGVSFERLYHSPWLRAVETAEALVELVNVEGGETIVTNDLACEPTATLLAELEGERVAVVGHQPWLGELIGLLVFGDSRKGARLVLKKGGVVLLEGKPRRAGMTIHAVLSPRVLRAAARK